MERCNGGRERTEGRERERGREIEGGGGRYGEKKGRGGWGVEKEGDRPEPKWITT